MFYLMIKTFKNLFKNKQISMYKIELLQENIYSQYENNLKFVSMKAKELAEMLLTKPESDVCIKKEYVINPHGDTDYCTKGIKSVGIENGKFMLCEK